MNRRGEAGEVPNRHQRFYENQHYWYYRTREGIDIGPFDTEADARRGSADFVDYVVNHNPAFGDVLTLYRPAA